MCWNVTLKPQTCGENPIVPKSRLDRTVSEGQWNTRQILCLGKKKSMFSGSMKARPGCFFCEESHFQTGKGCQWYEKLLWCITGAPQTWAEKATTGRMFLSAHCELREGKQVSRSVGCSRKTDYCTGISQGFQPWDVGYLCRGHAVGTHVQGLWNGDRPDLELKKSCRAKKLRGSSLGVSIRVMTLLVCCVLHTEFWLVMGALCSASELLFCFFFFLA